MTVSLRVDDRQFRVPDGMTLTAALVQAGVRAVSVNPVSGAPRGPFCGMGICFECRVIVDGRPHVRSCQVVCRAGMEVRTDG